MVLPGISISDDLGDDDMKSDAKGLRYYGQILVGAMPWLVSMYVLFWLEKSGTWVPETPHRDKITIAIVAVGMISSFFLYSYLVRKK